MTDDNPFCDLPSFFWFFLDIPEEFKGEWWKAKIGRLLSVVTGSRTAPPWGV